MIVGDDPSLLATFRALQLNLGKADTEAGTRLDAGTWQAMRAMPSGRGAPAWGIDLGSSAAMSAVAASTPSAPGAAS